MFLYKYFTPCHKLWQEIMIRANGDVYFCCLNKYPIGNLREQTFEEIWNGPIATEARCLMAEGKCPDICNVPACTYYAEINSMKENSDVNRSDDNTE